MLYCPDWMMIVRERGPWLALYDGVKNNHLEVTRLLLERGGETDRLSVFMIKTPEQTAQGKMMKELFEGTNREE